MLFVGKAQEKTRVVRSERRAHEPSGSYYAVSVRNYVCGPPFGETGPGSPIRAIVPSVLKRANRVIGFPLRAAARDGAARG